LKRGEDDEVLKKKKGKVALGNLGWGIGTSTSLWVVGFVSGRSRLQKLYDKSQTIKGGGGTNFRGEKSERNS